MLLEIRAGLVLVPLEVAEANRSHFASLGGRGWPGEGLLGSAVPPSSEQWGQVLQIASLPAKALTIAAFSSRGADKRSSKFFLPGCAKRRKSHRWLVFHGWVEAEVALEGRMIARMDAWYYREPSGTEVDDDPVVGPVSLDRLAELIRAGALTEDVPVSVDGVSWRAADETGAVLEALPLDRERLVREFIEYGEAPLGEENWGWASDRMYAILEGVPELAWSLITELISRAPSENSLRYFAAGPLEDLLSKDGELFIARVEELAASDAKFLHAVATLRRLGMSDDVWRRVQTLAPRDPIRRASA